RVQFLDDPLIVNNTMGFVKRIITEHQGLKVLRAG
ncbi:MAG: hypothetical protein JWO08_4135, partial [Verrucomicrobiaceae bacterium]|nr:hypothetical protein [Verrucomicrobiaceae bacterium]